MQIVIDAQEVVEKGSRRVSGFPTMTRRRPRRFNMRRYTTEPTGGFSSTARSTSEHDIAGRLARGRSERSHKNGHSSTSRERSKREKESKKRTSSSERSSGALSPRKSGSGGKRKNKSNANSAIKSPPLRRRDNNSLSRSSIRPDSSSPTYLDPQRNQLYASIPKRMVATPCVQESTDVLAGVCVCVCAPLSFFVLVFFFVGHFFFSFVVVVVVVVVVFLLFFSFSSYPFICCVCVCVCVLCVLCVFVLYFFLII
jgi:hypothetical protein